MHSPSTYQLKLAATVVVVAVFADFCLGAKSSLVRPVSSLGKRGSRQLWQMRGSRQRTTGVAHVKGQVNCEAAHPTGRRLPPQRLDAALGSAAGGKRIPEMSPTPIVTQTASIVRSAAAEWHCWKPPHTRWPSSNEEWKQSALP